MKKFIIIMSFLFITTLFLMFNKQSKQIEDVIQLFRKEENTSTVMNKESTVLINDSTHVIKLSDYQVEPMLPDKKMHDGEHYIFVTDDEHYGRAYRIVYNYKHGGLMHVVKID